MTRIVPGLVLEGYEFLKQIGSGGYSSVWQVRSNQYNRLFVAKIAIVRQTDVERAWRAFDREICALMRLDHPNIICLYAHFRFGENFIMILEWLPNGSLEDHIREKGPLDHQMLVQTIKDVCSALTYCWSLGVQHRDIKPANIMFDENGRAKLVDFGISITKRDEDEDACEVADYKCSLVCAAPELVSRIPYDPVKGDYWAMGITILWMAGGKVPWCHEGVKELMAMIKYGQFVVPPEMDPEIECLARKMLNTSPSHRVFPSEAEIGGLCSETYVLKARIKQPIEVLPCASFGQLRIGGGFRKSAPLAHLHLPRKRLNSGASLMKISACPAPPVIREGGSMRNTWKGGLNSALGPLSPLENESPFTLSDILEGTGM